MDTDYVFTPFRIRLYDATETCVFDDIVMGKDVSAPGARYGKDATGSGPVATLMVDSASAAVTGPIYEQYGELRAEWEPLGMGVAPPGAV